MLVEPLLSSALVRALLLVLELALPLDEPLEVDIVRNGNVEMAVLIERSNESYVVTPLQAAGEGPTAADPLFVAEPSRDYAHIYTVFSDAGEAAAADSDTGQAVPPDQPQSEGALTFPAVVDVGDAVSALAAGASGQGEQHYRLVRRGAISYLESNDGDTLLVVHREI